jgi:hypothetical protein
VKALIVVTVLASDNAAGQDRHLPVRVFAKRRILRADVGQVAGCRSEWETVRAIISSRARTALRPSRDDESARFKAD